MIFINESMPWDRIRWTLAHELGHILMHRLPTPNMEEEADRFASEFLMPASVIRPELSDLSLVQLASLKPRWKVAMSALLRQALALKKITERQYRYLWMRMSSLGWKTREPEELDILAEHPFLIKEFINLHLNTLKYSIQELCDVLGIYEDEFSSLYKLQIPQLRLIKGG
jgi:Zn-dependent peptidase ImmA (M78 family)